MKIRVFQSDYLASLVFAFLGDTSLRHIISWCSRRSRVWDRLQHLQQNERSAQYCIRCPGNRGVVRNVRISCWRRIGAEFSRSSPHQSALRCCLLLLIPPASVYYKFKRANGELWARTPTLNVSREPLSRHAMPAAIRVSCICALVRYPRVSLCVSCVSSPIPTQYKPQYNPTENTMKEDATKNSLSNLDSLTLLDVHEFSLV